MGSSWYAEVTCSNFPKSLSEIVVSASVSLTPLPSSPSCWLDIYRWRELIESGLFLKMEMISLLVVDVLITLLMVNILQCTHM